MTNSSLECWLCFCLFLVVDTKIIYSYNFVAPLKFYHIISSLGIKSKFWINLKVYNSLKFIIVLQISQESEFGKIYWFQVIWVCKTCFLSLRKHFFQGKRMIYKEKNECLSKTLSQSYLASKFALVRILTQTREVTFLKSTRNYFCARLGFYPNLNKIGQNESFRLLKINFTK